MAYQHDPARLQALIDAFKHLGIDAEWSNSRNLLRIDINSGNCGSPLGMNVQFDGLYVIEDIGEVIDAGDDPDDAARQYVKLVNERRD